MTKKLHIASPSGNKAEYDEEQIAAMWEQGLFDSRTLYWKEGMSEWALLSTYFTPSRVVPPPLPSVPPETAPLQSSPRARSYSAKAQRCASLLTPLIGVTTFVSIAYAIREFSSLGQQHAQVSRNSNDLSVFDHIDENDSVFDHIDTEKLAFEDYVEASNWEPFPLDSFDYIGSGLVIISAVVFLRWVYLANRSVRELGGSGLRYSARWAVGCYFIPVLNFVWPYQSMKEISQASKEPVDWKMQAADPIVGFWWCFWVAAAVLSNLSLRLDLRAVTDEQLRTAAYVSMAYYIAIVPVLIATMMLVAKIDLAQQTAAKRLTDAGATVD